MTLVVGILLSEPPNLVRTACNASVICLLCTHTHIYVIASIDLFAHYSMSSSAMRSYKHDVGQTSFCWDA